MTKIISDVCYEKEARLVYASTTDILIKDDSGTMLSKKILVKSNITILKQKQWLLYIKKCKMGSKRHYPLSYFSIGINDHKGSQAGKEIIKAANKTFLPMLKEDMILLMY